MHIMLKKVKILKDIFKDIIFLYIFVSFLAHTYYNV